MSNQTERVEPDVVRHTFETNPNYGLCLAWILNDDGYERRCCQPREAECHVEPSCEHSVSLAKDYVGPKASCPIHGSQPSNAAQDAKAEYDKWFPDPIPTTTASSADVVLSQPDAAQDVERDDIEQIVAVVRDEFNRQAGFGCRPSPQDYWVSIGRWLGKGVMPSDDEQ